MYQYWVGVMFPFGLNFCIAGRADFFFGVLTFSELWVMCALFVTFV